MSTYFLIYNATGGGGGNSEPQYQIVDGNCNPQAWTSGIVPIPSALPQTGTLASDPVTRFDSITPTLSTRPVASTGVGQQNYNFTSFTFLNNDRCVNCILEDLTLRYNGFIPGPTNPNVDYQEAGVFDGGDEEFISVESGEPCPCSTAVICFAADTSVITSTGPKMIQDITSSDTINGKQVHSLVSSIVRKNTDQLIKISKDALGENKPDKDTVCTVFHMILDGEDWTQAHNLVNGTTVTRFSNPENTRVYNILLADEAWGTMFANNLVTESLHPENESAKKAYASKKTITM
jgi:hypothetical protein